MPTSPTNGLVLLAGLMLALSGCSSTRSAADPFTGSTRGTVSVTVQNGYSDDANIYSRQLSRLRRVGSVRAGGSERFQLDWNVRGPLQFEVRLPGGNRCLTNGTQVDPGDQILVSIHFGARRRVDGRMSLCEMRRSR